MPQFPVLDGTLVLTSDGEILANNTDEGSASVPNGRKLEWRITQHHRRTNCVGKAGDSDRLMRRARPYAIRLYHHCRMPQQTDPILY